MSQPDMKAVYVADPARSNKILEALEQSDITVVQVFDFRRSFLPQLRSLFAGLRKKEIHFVLTDNQGKYGLFAFLVRCVSGIPYFIRLRGDFWDENRVATKNASGLMKLRSRLSRRLGQFLMNRSDGIIVNSHFIESVVLDKTNVPKQKIKVVEIPLGKKFMELTSGNNRPANDDQTEGPLVLLSVTNFNIPKKLEGLIFFLPLIKRAFSELSTDCAWIVAGDGPLKETFARALERHGLEKVTTLAGMVDNIEDYYSQANVLIHFSFQDAFPNVVLEAQSFGLPVCVNRFGGMLEQVEDEETGLIVDNIVNESSFDKFKRIILDPAFRQRIGANGKTSVYQKFTTQIIGRKFEESIFDLMRK